MKNKELESFSEEELMDELIHRGWELIEIDYSKLTNDFSKTKHFRQLRHIREES